MKRVSLVLSLAVAAGLSAQTASAQTLKAIQDRGMLSCGVSQGLPGFSSPDDKGNWTGLDVDIWFERQPGARRAPADRENPRLRSLVRAADDGIDDAVFTDQHVALLHWRVVL